MTNTTSEWRCHFVKSRSEAKSRSRVECAGQNNQKEVSVSLGIAMLSNKKRKLQQNKQHKTTNNCHCAGRRAPCMTVVSWVPFYTWMVRKLNMKINLFKKISKINNYWTHFFISRLFYLYLCFYCSRYAISFEDIKLKQ